MYRRLLSHMFFSCAQSLLYSIAVEFTRANITTVFLNSCILALHLNTIYNNVLRQYSVILCMPTVSINVPACSSDLCWKWYVSIIRSDLIRLLLLLLQKSDQGAQSGTKLTQERISEKVFAVGLWLEFTWKRGVSILHWTLWTAGQTVLRYNATIVERISLREINI